MLLYYSDAAVMAAAAASPSGNSALHMCVLCDQVEMYDHLVDVSHVSVGMYDHLRPPDMSCVDNASLSGGMLFCSSCRACVVKCGVWNVRCAWSCVGR